MKNIKLAPGVSLDADYVGGGTFALLAKKGAGKTYAMRVMAEEFFTTQVPFVALDPMDAFWGLRSSADGEGAGLPIPIFGGPHGDAPLEPTAGKLMADLVVDEGVSMVLSTKHFGSRSAERSFAMAFLERLYRRNSELVHLLIDEADLFAPQKPRRDDAQLLVITENIVRRGRNNGIGVTMATQRPAVLNKDVLTQVDGLIVMRMLGPNDRNAIDDWVGEHGDTGLGREVKGSLPDLETGEAWIWVPELEVLKRTKIRASHTFDSSPTRRRGATAREPKTIADVDLGKIEKLMAETIERAKAEDPRELRKRIKELERAGKTVEVEKIVEQRVEVPIEVPVVSDEQINELSAITLDMRDLSHQLSARAEQIEEALRHVRDADVRRDRAPAARDRRVAQAHRPDAERPAARPREQDPAGSNGEARIGKGELKVLGVLAEFPEGKTQNEVAFLAGYSANASTIGVKLSKLRKAGLVEPGQPVRPTQAGLDYIGGPFERPSGQDLIDHWLRHPRMGEGERKVFLALLDLYPEEPTHEELCEITGYSADASTMGVKLSKLRKLGLVQRGARKLSDELMEAVAA